MTNKIQNLLVALITYTISAVAGVGILLLGGGVILGLALIASLLKGTVLWLIYPFLYKVFGLTVGVPALTWWNSVLVALCFNLLKVKITFKETAVKETLTNSLKKWLQQPTKNRQPKVVYGQKK